MAWTYVLAHGVSRARAFCVLTLFLAWGTGLGHAAGSPCDPLTYGGVADGTTDNAAAIQAAINGCAANGGGLVRLRVVAGKGIYLSSPITLASHVGLYLDAGVILRATNDHTKYRDARPDHPYRPGEALVSAVGAVDTGIIGQGTIDGQGGVTAADGGPSWWELTRSEGGTVASIRYHSAPYADRPVTYRLAHPWLVEFYRCSDVSVNGITFINPPLWSLVFRYSSNITASQDTIKVTPDPMVPHTDGIDLIGSTHATLINIKVRNGGAAVALKSGRQLPPLSHDDPNGAHLGRLPTHDVSIANSAFSNGEGITLGGEGAGGVYNVLVRNITETGTRYGLMIRSDQTRTDKATDTHDIIADNIALTDSFQPLAILAGLPSIESSVGATPPVVVPRSGIHDIRISGFMATSASGDSVIAGVTPVCIWNVSLNNVNISTKGMGVQLRNMTGTFTNVASKPVIGPAFVAGENVDVIAVGTTPAIASTKKPATLPDRQCGGRRGHPT